MGKYILLLCLIWLTACESDPLEVREIDTDDRVTADGLAPLAMDVAPEGWTEENGILTASAPATLELLPEHEALTLALSLRVDESTEASLLLGGSYALQLPSLDLSGGSAGKRSRVAMTPGIWQDLELAYQPGSQGAPPLLVAAYLNGNLVYYQDSLSGSGDGRGPLILELTAGTLSVAEVRTLGRAGKPSTLTSDGEVVLNLPLIHYSYYEVADNPDDVTDYGTRVPAKEGYIGRFDIGALREGDEPFAARFTAVLDVPKAGEYTFNMFSPSSTRMYIDDQLVVDHGGRHAGFDDFERSGKVTLGEGSHRFRMDHYQYGGWNRFNLNYTGPDGSSGSLNDMPEDRAVATPASADVVALETDDRPYLLRSFLNYPPGKVYDFTDKRTHVVNVGEGDGPHYSYDLQRGSLLQVWRGDFVDVSEMWVERGEPQVVRALGSVVAFDGKAEFSDSESEWPDSLTELRHLRYELDEAGRPTFFFGDDERLLSDRIEPEGAGLFRTLTNEEGATTYVQLAAARRITETGPGSFELRGPGAQVEVTDLAAGGLRLLRGQGIDRLVAELPTGEHISYTLNW